jgi:NADH-quinone oxidoreductase subunit J
MEMELHLFFLIAFLLVPAILAVFAAELINAVIALLIGSVGLTLILFNLGAPVAGIFELSVGAGLITVLFILSISLTRVLSREANMELKKQHYYKFIALPIILLILAIILYLNREQWFNIFSVHNTQENNSVGEVLWGTRGLDLIGQISILLVGVFGVVVLFKRGKMNE